jgi:hypothetical protein
VKTRSAFPIEILHHSDPRKHQRSATLGRHDQHLDRDLPPLVLLLGAVS